MSNVRLREEIAAPNLVKICVDEYAEHDLKGRVYHKYAKQPGKFGNLVQLLCYLETFYNQISFPEEAEELRRFVKNKDVKQRSSMNRDNHVPENGTFLAEKGDSATFFVYVQYRQNATWQGKLTWEEKRKA